MLRYVWVCLGCLALAASAARAQQTLERLFYYVDTENSYTSLTEHIDQITVLGPQVYTVDSLGIVWGSLDRRVLALARRHGVKVMPLVVNEGFNQPALRRLPADPPARARGVRSLVQLSLGVPLWSEHWFSRYDASLPERARSWSETVSWAWGSGLAERNGATVRWDSVQAVPWAMFENGGVFEWVFLNDVRSFRAELGLAREKKLRGFSAWVLGPEDERVWDVLRTEVRR